METRGTMNLSQLPNRRVFVASNSPNQTADYQDRAAEAVTSPRTPGSRHFDSGDRMKQCTLCKQWKDESDFHKTKAAPDGLSGKCKNCKSAYDRWLKDNPASSRKWGKKVTKLRRDLSKYGITPDDYEALSQKQGGVCAVCKQPPKFPKTRLCVDHDHETGRVRGLLCNECNVALGAAKDSMSVLEKMIAYLKGE